MKIYANEIDPVACAVLRATLPGARVDERSIKDVRPEDLVGFDRVHFFAGAGLWDVACDLAGWWRPIWTASCPCQPFSVAGKGAGFDDPRHLWPDAFRLVRECRPWIIVGEQVGGKAGYGWLDGVFADLESIGYACWAVDIPACAVDAPHRRNRIYWVAMADADDSQRWSRLERRILPHTEKAKWHEGSGSARKLDARSVLADADGCRRDGRQEDAQRFSERRDAAEWSPGELEHAYDFERRIGANGRHRSQASHSDGPGVALGDTNRARTNLNVTRCGSRPTIGESNSRSFWTNSEWIGYADGKARRVKPGIRLLVDGMVGRVHLWRLAGNSIVPQIAAEVLGALQDELDVRDAP